jgi:hypothetical protein
VKILVFTPLPELGDLVQQFIELEYDHEVYVISMISELSNFAKKVDFNLILVDRCHPDSRHFSDNKVIRFDGACSELNLQNILDSIGS